jgi:hypothetical protein
MEINMLKKKLVVMSLLPMIIVLAACTGLQLPGTSSTNNTTSQQNQAGRVFDMAKLPVEQKLALGTLKLEGTDKAVTVAQAKSLLPLWKAVKSMSSGSNISEDEINAVYKQIQETMNAEQVQAIKDLNLSQADFQALMKQFGIQAPQMGQGNPSGTLVPRSQSGSSASGSGGAQAGGPPGGGIPGGDMGGPGGPPPDGGFSGGGQPNSQGTMPARPAGGGFRAGMNMIFVDPLIKVLEQRAGG